jgi:hypothetical protein
MVALQNAPDSLSNRVNIDQKNRCGNTLIGLVRQNEFEIVVRRGGRINNWLHSIPRQYRLELKGYSLLSGAMMRLGKKHLVNGKV